LNLSKKIGILGGGQLGKMLCEAASPMHLNLHILDRDKNFPAAWSCPRFHLGDFTNYDDVMTFAKDMDIVSIEIEKVNLEALVELENAGKTVIPSSSVVRTIRDKGIQKNFYKQHGLDTSPFTLYDDRHGVWTAIMNEEITYPFVQKARRDGYDGRGVSVIRSEDDLPDLMDVPCLVEDMVDIYKELAIMVARNPSGDITTFPLVEMEFDEKANLVNDLVCPAEVSISIDERATSLAIDLAEKIELTGLLAIELFLTQDGDLIINEVAPRPHNSGHHTIEACNYSQYDIHIRCLLDLPLPEISLLRPAGMMNLLGSADHSGAPKIVGLHHIFETADAYLHWYGKPETRPNRKMGHVTVLGDNLTAVREKLAKLSHEVNITT